MRKEIAPLTGLRGVAACWVVVYHVHEFDLVGGPFGALLKHGYLAVDVFFILSGFVMALSYQPLFAAGFTGRNYAKFLLRRVARIYPLYAVMTAIIVLLMLRHLGSRIELEHILARFAFNVTLTDAWGLSSPFDGPAWSISTEIGAYLLFPLLAVATLYRSDRVAIITAIVCGLILSVIAYVPTPRADIGLRQGPLDLFWGGTAWPLLRCITEFSTGLIAYRFANDPGVQRICASNTFAVATALACVGVLVTPGTDMVFVTLVPGLILAMSTGRNMLARLFSSRVLLLLGRLSYAIYLLHFPMFPPFRRVGGEVFGRVLSPAWADAAALIVFYIVLLIAAEVAFRCIEVPGRRIIRRVGDRYRRHGLRTEGATLSVANDRASATPARS